MVEKKKKKGEEEELFVYFNFKLTQPQNELLNTMNG